MTIFAGEWGDKVIVDASADGDGIHACVNWVVRPGEQLFGFSYEELAQGGTFEVTPERWQRFGDEVQRAGEEVALPAPAGCDCRGK